jgi:hypothetical protein
LFNAAPVEEEAAKKPGFWKRVQTGVFFVTKYATTFDED